MKDVVTDMQANKGASLEHSEVELKSSGELVTAYILYSQEPDEFNAAAKSVSYGGAELLSAKVYGDEAEAISFAEVTGAKLKEVKIPGGLARDAFIKKWLKAAKKNKQGLLPFLLLPLAACGGGGGGSSSSLLTSFSGTLAAANALNAALYSSSFTVTLSDAGSMDAGDLGTLLANTSGAVTGASVTELAGTAAEIGTVLAKASQVTSLNAVNITSSDAATVAQVIAADSFTTGVITSVISDGDVATLKTLTDANSNNVLTIVVTDPSADAGDLAIIDGITSVTVDAQTNVTTITGSAAEIIALLSAAGTNIAANVNFVIDEAASAANIQTIAAATTGEITATLLAGENTLNLSTSTASKNTIILNDDGVNVTGSSQIDVITVGSGADTLNLGLGDDVVNVNSGDGAGDTINTESGNDNVFINDGAVGASDVIAIDTGADTDIVTVSGTNFFNASGAFGGTPTVVVNSNVTFTADQIASVGGAIEVAAGGSGEHAITLVQGVGAATAVSLTALTGITSLSVGAGVEVILSDDAVDDLVATVTTATDAGYASVGLNLNSTAVASVSAAAKTTLTTGSTPAIDAADLFYAIKDTASNILAEESSSDGYIVGATSVTVTDAISISDFNLIDTDANENIILAGGISDTADNIAPSGTAAAAFTAAVTQDPDVAVTITGTDPTFAQLNTISGATSGIVTASISDTAANLAGSLSTASTDAITVTVTGTSADAANLNTIDGVTSLAVVAASAATITGTAAAIVTAAQSAGITTATDYAATVNSGTLSVANALILDADTTGVITASVAEGGLTTLKTLTNANSNNALTITVTDTSADPADLIAVDALTSVAVNARNVETLTGSVSDLNDYRTAFEAGTISGLSVYSVVTNDTSAAASDLLTLADTSPLDPDTNLASIETITGGTAQIQTLYALQSTGAQQVSGLGNEVIVLDDTGSVDATTLTIVAALTTDGNVSASNAIAISGTADEVTAALVTDTTKVVASSATVAISDSGSIASTVLAAIAAKTSGTVTASSITEITEAAATIGTDAATVLSALGVAANAAVTITGAISAADLDLIANATNGVVTATISDGAVATTLTAISNVDANDVITFTTTDTSADASDLVDLNAKVDNFTATTVTTITEAAATIGTNAATVVSALAIVPNAAVTITGAISAANADLIANATNGVVTATISDGAVAATLTAISNVDANDVITFTTTDTSADASDLVDLNVKVDTFTTTTVATITEAAATIGTDAATVLSALGVAANAAVTITGAISAANADLIANATNGVVTATISDGAVAATLAAIGNVDANDVITFTTTDTSADASDLVDLNVKVDTFTTTTVATITEAAATIGTDAATVLSALGVAANAAVTITGAISAANADLIANATNGVVTATISDGAVAATLTAISNVDANDVITFTTTDTSADASDLVDLNVKVDTFTATTVTTITEAAATIGTNAATVVSALAIVPNAAVTITGAISAANADLIANATNGVVTATISDGAVAATLTAISNVDANDVITFTTTDTSADASDLVDLNVKVDTFTATTVTTITEAAATIGTNAATVVSALAIVPNAAVTITGAISAANADLIANATDGVVTATISDGAVAATLAAISNVDANDVITFTTTDTSADASDLVDLNAKVDNFTATTVTTITEAAATIGTDAATVLSALGVASNAAVTITGAISAANADLIADATNGVVTATVSDTAIADLTGISGTGNALTITVGTATVSASDLIAVNAATTETVTATTAVTRVNGSVAESLALITDVGLGEITGLTAAQFRLSDAGSNDINDIITITSFTSGRVVSFAETYVGSVADFGSTSAAASFFGLISSADLITNSSFSITLSSQVSATAQSLLDILSSITTLSFDVNVDASAVSAITGTAADLVSLAQNSNITTAGDHAMTVTDQATVAELVAINAATSGAITLSVVSGALSGSAANLTAAFAGTITGYTGALTISDAHNLAQLVAINNATSGAITFNDASVALSGSSADVTAALTGTTYTGTATVSDAHNLAQLVAINNATSGAITFNDDSVALSGSSADVTAALTGTTYTGTATLTDQATVAQLVTVNAATSGAITLNVVSGALSGSAANLTAAFAGTITGYTGALTISDTHNLAQLVAINNATSGAITFFDASVSLNGSSADVTAALTGTTYTGTATVSDAHNLAQLVAINNATSGAITFNDDSVALSGSSADVTAALDGTTYTGAVTLTDQATVAQLVTVNAATSGAITLNVVSGALSGSAANLTAAFAGTITGYTGALTVTDQATLAELVAINAATSGAITLNVVSGALSGSAADLTAAFAGTITGYTGALTISDTHNLAQLVAINNATSGAITFNDDSVALSGSSADVTAALTGTTYTGTATVSDAHNLAQLVAINNATSGAITFNDDSVALSGSSADVTAALDGTTYTGAVTLTDQATVAQLVTVNAATSGNITLNVVSGALSGSAANLTAAFAGTITGYTGALTVTDQATLAELVAINAATSGAITLNVVSGALSGSAADLTAAFAGTITGYTGALTVTDSPTLAQFAAINNATSGAITVADDSVVLSGSSADVTAALTGMAYTGAVTLTDQATLTELVTVNAATSGAITLNVVSGALSGSAADLTAAFAGTITGYTGALTVTDQATLAELVAINAATSGAITLNVVSGALSGSAADLTAAFAGTITGYTGALTISDTHNLAQLVAINNATSGAITFNDDSVALSGSSADVTAALTGTTYTGTATVSDAHNLAQLVAINNATSGAITFNDDSVALSGSSADVTAALDGTTYTGAVTLTDQATVAQLVTVNAATSGAITLNVVSGALSGSAANLTAAFAGTITGYTGALTISDAHNLAQLVAINNATSGAITFNDASVALSGSSADVTAALTGTTYTGTATVSDAHNLAQLVAINNATSGAITFNDDSVALSGSSADVTAALDGTTYTGAATLTDQATVAQLVTVNAATSGAITLNVVSGALSGSAANLTAAFAGTITGYTGALTVTDQATLAELVAINAATSGAITLNVVSGALSGSAADLTAAFAGTITGYTGALTISDAHNLAQLVAINNATSGAITFNDASVALSGSSADVTAALTGTTYTGTATVSDAHNLAQLVAINNATSGAITFNDDSVALSGSSADVTAALDGTTYTGAVTLTDQATVAQLVTVNAATSGAITLNVVSGALSGSAANLTAAFAGTITGYTGALTISDAHNLAQLVAINNATSGAITFNDASVALSGSSADVTAALTGTTYTGTATVSDAHNLAQLVAINNATSGAITFNDDSVALSGSSADVTAALDGTTYTGAATVSDAHNLAQLVAINNATSGAITFNDDSVALSGSSADVTAALTGTTYTGTATLTDQATLAQLVTVNAATSGAITLNVVSGALSGSAANLTAAFAGTITGYTGALTISDAHNLAQLVAINNATSGAITFNDASVSLNGSSADVTAALDGTTYTGLVTLSDAHNLAQLVAINNATSGAITFNDDSVALSGSSADVTAAITGTTYTGTATLTDQATLAQLVTVNAATSGAITLNVVSGALSGSAANLTAAFAGTITGYTGALTISDAHNLAQLVAINNATSGAITFNDASVALSGSSADVTAALTGTTYTGTATVSDAHNLAQLVAINNATSGAITFNDDSVALSGSSADVTAALDGTTYTGAATVSDAHNLAQLVAINNATSGAITFNDDSVALSGSSADVTAALTGTTYTGTATLTDQATLAQLVTVNAATSGAITLNVVSGALSGSAANLTAAFAGTITGYTGALTISDAHNLAQLVAINNATSGAITFNDASVALSGSSADVTAALTGTTYTGTATVSDAHNLAQLVAINNATSGAITFNDDSVALSGSSADVTAALDGTTYTGAVTLTDQATVAQLVTVNAATSGAITLNVVSGALSGSAANLTAAFAGTITGYTGALTISDAHNLAQLVAINNATSGAITFNDASVALSGSSADVTAALTGTTYTGTATVSDAHNLAQLVAINNATSGAITFNDDSVALSGSSADVTAALDGTTYTGAATVSDAHNLAQLVAINNATSGAITFNDDSVALSGSSADVTAALTGTTYTGTATLTDQATLAQLVTVNAATSGAITLNVVSGALSGSAANLTAAFAGTITGYTGALTISDAHNLAQLVAINNATSGAITFNDASVALSGSSADVTAALTGTTYTGTATVSDAHNLAQLVAINNATSGAITFNDDSVALSGSSADVTAALDGTTYTGAVTLTDQATVAQLVTVNAATSGAITLNVVSGALSGSAANLTAAFAGTITGYTGALTISDAHNLAQLVAINNATSGAITFNDASVALSGSSADVTAALTGTTYTGTATVSDAHNLAQLVAINNATSGAITFNDDSVALSGSSADVTAALDGTTYTGAATVSDAHNLAQLVAINNATSGAITFNDDSVALSGSSADVTAALTGTTYTGTATLTDQATVAQLVTVNAATSGAITLNVVSGALSGSAANLTAAFAGTITGYTGALTISDAHNLAQLVAINNATSGAITFNDASVALSGSSADVTAALTGTTYTGTATVSDAHNLAQLVAINNATSGAITFNDDSVALSGSSADVTAALDGTTYTGAATLTDQATVAQLVTVNAATSGAITLNVVSGALSGSAANLTAAFAGTITGYTGALTISDAHNLAQLVAINNATSGAITFNDASVALSGSSADVTAALTGTTYTGTATVSDAHNLAQLVAINNATSGAITFNDDSVALSGTAANLTAALDGMTAYTGTATMSDTSLAATTLNTLDGNTTGNVIATAVTTLTGAVADVNTAYAAGANGTITNLGDEAVTLTGSASVAELTTLDAYTSGVITAADITDTYSNIKTLATNSPTLLQNETGTVTANGTFLAETMDMSDVGALANLTINGAAGDDIILGAQGNDTITGGTGNDTLFGGLGTDIFVVSDVETNGSDNIFTFTSSTDGATIAQGADQIQFSTADLTAVTGYAAYGGGGTTITLSDATLVEFVAGAGAAADEAGATMAFDTSTGQLSYDADGTGTSASAIVIATLYSDSGTTAITDLLVADLAIIA